MINKIRNFLNFNSISRNVEIVLDLEKSIQLNKDEALSKAEYYVPIISKLEKSVKAMEIFCGVQKDDIKKAEGEILLDKLKDKFSVAKSEYYTNIGELRKSNKLLGSKISRLMSNNKINEAVNKFKYKVSLGDSFNHITDEFIKGNISPDLYAKSIVNFKKLFGNPEVLFKSEVIDGNLQQDIDNLGKIDEELLKKSEEKDSFKEFFPKNEENIEEIHEISSLGLVKSLEIIEKAIDRGKIEGKEVKKAKKVAQEKKVAKVMSEFKAGTLKSGSGKVVTDKDQALAIAMNEARLSKGGILEEPIFELKKSEGYTKKQLEEMVKEHIRLINILEPHAKMDNKVAKELEIQRKELKGYIKELNSKKGEDLEKGRAGIYADNSTNRRLKRVGQTYGDKKQQESPEGKKTGKKEEPKGEKQSIEEQAKAASGSSLETASKESKDPEVRSAAYKELERREKEEKVQGEEEKGGEGKKKISTDEQIKGNTEKLKQLQKDAFSAVGEGDMDKFNKLSGEISDLMKEQGELSQKEKYEKGAKVEEKLKKLGLSSEEVESLVDYTGSGYKDINESLRKGTVSPETQNKVNNINNALSKLPDYIGSVHRGIKIPDNIENLIKEWGKGGILNMDSFTSTSTSDKVAASFGGVRMEIKSKSGKDISGISEFGEGESEILFKTGAKFKISDIEVKRGKSGNILTVDLKMEEL